MLHRFWKSLEIFLDFSSILMKIVTIILLQCFVFSQQSTFLLFLWSSCELVVCQHWNSLNYCNFEKLFRKNVKSLSLLQQTNSVPGVFLQSVCDGSAQWCTAVPECRRRTGGGELLILCWDLGDSHHESVRLHECFLYCVSGLWCHKYNKRTKSDHCQVCGAEWIQGMLTKAGFGLI